ncbi:MAG: sugar phosphate isomerase/epimerase family protein [Deinococcota bacterium]
MKLGFVSAILPDLSLEEVLAFAASEGFDCVEVMCWPAGGGDTRRYAGVTHIDVDNLDVKGIQGLVSKYGVDISGLGYYPNPLVDDADEREMYVSHIEKVITAAGELGVNIMNTFIGRDPAKSIEDNWPLFEELWPPIIAHAESQGVKVGIENCPMLFSLDEWPGGKNLAISPEVWRKMFETIPSKHFGLNFDPSHLLWQGIDHIRAMHDFADRFVHAHIKDEKVHPNLMYERGILGLKWHDPKIPGLGDIDWTEFCNTLDAIGYDGYTCIEVEDRAFEDSLEGRKQAIRESKRHIDLARTKG